MAALHTASLEEAAVLVNDNRPARTATIVGVGLVCLLMAPWQVCAGWTVAVGAIEFWGIWATRGHQRNQAMSRPAKLNFLAYFVALTVSWIVLASVLWRIGTLSSLCSAAVIVSTVGIMMPLLIYQSPAFLMMAGMAPVAAVMAVVAVRCGLTATTLVPSAVFLTLGLMVAFGRTRAMPSALAAQQQLALSETQFRIMTNNISEVIARSGLDGEHIYLSPQAEELTGYAIKKRHRAGPPVAHS